MLRMRFRLLGISLLLLQQLHAGASASEVPFLEYKQQYEQCLADRAAAHSDARTTSVLGVSFVAPRGYEVAVNDDKSLVLSPYQERCVEALKARGLPHPMHYRGAESAGQLDFDADPGQFAIFTEWSDWHLEGSPLKEVTLLGVNTTIYQARGGLYALIPNPRQGGKMLVWTSLVGEAESLAFITALAAD